MVDPVNAVHTRLVHEPLDSNPDHPEAPLVAQQRHGLLALLHDVHLQVVLQVLTHSRHVLHHGDAHVLEVKLCRIIWNRNYKVTILVGETFK